ncbi:hypothetical protein DY000_02048465 [Brassica cretica]|uniref:Histone chaperone domain-containing protein n=1 Tax=Brassica cretica TaxID=69181 RepID=A0ABQ7EW61_BRACR|nr:hypothetical protein DY000_02048465 [Brassica cretica]
MAKQGRKMRTRTTVSDTETSAMQNRHFSANEDDDLDIEEPERLGFGVGKIQQEDNCVGRTRRPLMNTTVSEKQTVSESDGEDDGALVQM